MQKLANITWQKHADIGTVTDINDASYNSNESTLPQIITLLLWRKRQENFAEMIATQMTDCTKTSKVARNSTF